MATKIEIRQEYRNSLKLQQVLAVAFMCSIVIFILMSVCLMSSYWITADGFRQGLLYLCIEETSSISRAQYEPLPFDLNKEELAPGCYPNRDVAYLKICTIFCLITQLSALASALLSGLGIRLKGSRRVTCVRFAICTTLVTLLCDMCLIVIYPTQFSKEIDKSNRSLWELNSAFGLASGAGILTFGTLILLVAVFAKNSYIYESAPTRI
uniref:Uncharacterized protein n=1 Tax=Aceria tosichella TaxID=561515 RepID=A0A6G1SBD5_9ACAR